MSTATLRHGGLSTGTLVSRLAETRPSAGGLLARLRGALARARRARKDRAIDAYVELNGGKITDALEREIEQRFLFGHR
jgi:hypothetical protein